MVLDLAFIVFSSLTLCRIFVEQADNVNGRLPTLRQAVLFTPPLPPLKISAIKNLGIALMDKIELLWESRWWPPTVDSIDIASSESTPTYHPWPWFYEPTDAGPRAILVCFITGSFAEEVEAMDETQVVARCIEVLREAFPTSNVPEPSATHITRWGCDAFSAGSWTYYAKVS